MIQEKIGSTTKAGIGGVECLTNKSLVVEQMKKLGIEFDDVGRAVLYHATLAEHAMDISKEQVLVPAMCTGNVVYRDVAENELKKITKIYLATKSAINRIAKNIQVKHGGSVFIYEVHVDVRLLRSDEDYGDDLLNSLEQGGTCSYEGAIDGEHFACCDVLPFDLSEDEKRKHRIVEIRGGTNADEAILSATKEGEELEEMRLRG